MLAKQTHKDTAHKGAKLNFTNTPLWIIIPQLSSNDSINSPKKKEIIKKISIASDKEDKMFIPAPVFPVKMLASIFDRFDWFPISREQLIMLLEGNICDGTIAFDLFEIKNPISFALDSLKYLSNEIDE